MFRPTDRQSSLLQSKYLLPAVKAKRLERSWAHQFRVCVMPLIDEEVFRDAFCDNNGRPNKSIRLLMGAHILKHWNDLTDAEVIEQVEFNLQWQYALDITPEEAHLVQRTMHDFRKRLITNDRGRRIFEDITRKLATADGISLGRQRLDSTHVISNIAVLTRLTLFVETITKFLHALRKEHSERLDDVSATIRRRYLEREGYFNDAKREQAKRRLPVVARDLHALVVLFGDDKAVSALPSFELVLRLFSEQCEVMDADDDGGEGDGGEGDGGEGDGGEGDGGDDNDSTPTVASTEPKIAVKLREPKTVSSDSLQSPHDPDATYGHKGKGYEVQISETCDDANGYQLITLVDVNGANESDQTRLVPLVDQLKTSDLAPSELLADTGYGSGKNIVEAGKRGVALLAPVPDSKASKRPDPFLRGSEDSVEQTPAPEASDQPSTDDEFTIPTFDFAAFAFGPNYTTVLGCPADHSPDHQHFDGKMLLATFSAEQCRDCLLARHCPTRELKDGRRQLRRAATTLATECRQFEQQTSHFKERYKKRGGVEATNSVLKGPHGLARLRVRGKPRVGLAAMMKALALNTKRAAQYHVAQVAAANRELCMV